MINVAFELVHSFEAHAPLDLECETNNIISIIASRFVSLDGRRCLCTRRERTVEHTRTVCTNNGNGQCAATDDINVYTNDNLSHLIATAVASAVAETETAVISMRTTYAYLCERLFTL